MMFQKILLVFREHQMIGNALEVLVQLLLKLRIMMVRLCNACIF